MESVSVRRICANVDLLFIWKKKRDSILELWWTVLPRDWSTLQIYKTPYFDNQPFEVFTGSNTFLIHHFQCRIPQKISVLSGGISQNFWSNCGADNENELFGKIWS